MRMCGNRAVTSRNPECDLGSLYADHHGWLQSWLRGKMGDSGEATDLAQDTFLRLLVMQRRTDRLGERPRALLTHIAKGLLIDHWRRKRVERAYLEMLVHLPPAEAPAAEMESYYRFTWAPRSRGPRPRPEGEARGPRRPRHGAAATAEGGDRGPDPRPRPQGERGPDQRAQGEGAGPGDRNRGRRMGGRQDGDAPGNGPRGEGKPPRHGKGGDRHERGGERGDRPERSGKPPRGGKPEGGRSYEARPPRAEKPIDPDSPFAVLAALKNRS